MISDWKSAFVLWRKRRRRFTEEWNFHREALISEFESRGYGKREARIAAAQRMGARFRYRREALGAMGGNWQGLLSLLPIRSTARSPFLAPIVLILGPVLALVLNPQRVMALRCIDAMLLFQDLPAMDRIIPLAPSGLAPVELPAVLLRIAAVIGLGMVVAAPRPIYARLYAGVVLLGIMLTFAVAWVTGMQVLASRSWGHDGLQGLALLSFMFAFTGILSIAMWRWRLDFQARCPCCMRLPGMPRSSGRVNDLIIDPLQTDSICFRGHGSVIQTRWSRRFRPATPLF